MTAAVTEIWRHPIKSHDRESLPSVTLEAGQAMPLDRLRAVAEVIKGATITIGAEVTRV